ncbi:MAG: aspartate aminotransferase family protein [Deltaproteobacteria bacterium]|nr:aspartate aminotransferase family protein [Deltaproteobacteria bacterium]MBI4412346.1 aspartate aminotransferase family protein [Deltaproteobacteria bacterium]
MPFDIHKLIESREGENYALHSNYINPQFAKVLKTIGFDKVYTKAKGPYLYDKDGNEYLDFLSGYGVFAIGRNHPKIKLALTEFIDKDRANLVQMEAPLLSGLLAEALIKRVNQDGIDTVFFTNSGTESNECAIKFARGATGRKRILYLHHAFHGLSTGSLALNGNTEFREGFGDLLPGCEMIRQNDLNQLEDELKKKDVAAFIYEPIQGKGVYIPHDDTLPQAQKLCQKYGTLAIADEIQTGLGRTGKWFGFEHWNLNPDIITVSKSLSGGMVPVGATLTRRSIYNKVFSRMDRCVVHSSTFGQNDLAMVCGLATLSIIEEEGLVEKARMRGEEIVEGLKKLDAKHEWIKEIRGRGLMIGIEFGKPTSLKKKIQWNMVHQINSGLFGELIVMPLLAKHRILTQVSGHEQDVVKILPPLVIEPDHVGRFVTALDSVLEECGQITGPMWEMGKNLVKHALADRKAATA